MSGPTEEFAAYLATLDPGDLDDAARARFSLVWDDTLACTVAGLSEAKVAKLARSIAGAGSVEPLTGLTGSPSEIALVLGYAGAALELDEGNYAAGGHPAVHAFATALAEAARTGVDDAARRAAFLAGYEAGARVGYAAALRPEAHAHGTWGAVGAAVAAARIRGFDAARIAAVIDIAGSLGLATSVTAPIRGGDVRSVWAGAAARNGILACDLVEAGVDGEPDGCAAVFGRVIGTAFDHGRLVEAIGTRFFVLENFMKLDACCRETQGALAALDAAWNGSDPGAITAVEIETFADAARLSNTAPANAMAARFSIPAALAARILHGPIAAESFAPERLSRPAFRALAGKVMVGEWNEANAALPERRLCRCTIHRADGAPLSATVDRAPGDPSDPLPAAVLRAKHTRLAPGLYPAA